MGTLPKLEDLVQASTDRWRQQELTNEDYLETMEGLGYSVDLRQGKDVPLEIKDLFTNELEVIQ